MRRLQKPARILALGPLTNLALALRRDPGLAKNIQTLVIMGGAIHVPGNLPDGGYYQTANRTAEWNLYIDPEAAEIVFRAVRTIRLVPLDATNRVPFRTEHVAAFARQAAGTLGGFMKQILKMDEPLIREGIMYAWDPLAAVAAAEPAKVPMRAAAVAIRLNKNEEGRTAPVAGRANIQAALDANERAFHEEFLGAFR
jgi:pyrimidine-specific ribonucleoside hydrolase